MKRFYRTYRKIILFSLLFVLLFGIAGTARAVDWLPLVPCGLNTNPTNATNATQDYTRPCTGCDLFHLLRNLIFLIEFGLVPVGGTLLFMYAGILYILSGANPSYSGRARSIFANTFYAILIISLAWLITNTVLKSIASDEISSSWFTFQCQAPAPAAGVTPTPSASASPGASPTAGASQQAAQALLAAGVTFSTKGDCGAAYTAQTSIQAVASGNLPPVCSPSCDCKPGGSSGTVTVNPAILTGLTALKNNGINFTVTSLTTGQHSAGSTHYSGNAADIVVTGDSGVWQQAVRFLLAQGGTAFCETTSGHADATCTIPPTDHIHWNK